LLLYHAEKAKDYETQLWATYNFAVIYSQVRRLKESVEYAEKALALTVRLKNNDIEFKTLVVFFELSQNLYIDKLPEKLLRLKRLAKQRIKDKRAQITVAWAEAYYYIGLGNPSRAIGLMRKCCTLAKQRKDEKNYLYFSHTLASLLADLCKFKEAKQLLDYCLIGFRKVGDKAGEMLVLQELGNVETYFDPKKAIAYNQQCIEIAKTRFDDLIIANALHSMGAAYWDLELFTEAEKSYLESERITKEIGDTKGLLSTYLELAGLMIHMKRLDEASKYIQTSKQLCEKDNAGAIARIILREAQLLEAEGKLEQAKDKYVMANESFNQLDERVQANFASAHASNIEDRPLNEWIINLGKGLYKSEIGQDGFTDYERRLSPFVGKKVRIVYNQGKWPGISSEDRSEMRMVFEGIFCRSDYKVRLDKMSKLMGHGKYDWWIEGKPIEGITDGKFGNWNIAPIFVETIVEIE
jgi:tetratricopeptide (TPR) repeat protein